LEKTVKAGSKGRLNIVFNGVVNDKMAGFYRSSYQHEGKQKYMASTQFEATDARRAFPCWDEPAAKASFTISIKVPESVTALSNMDVKAVASDSNSKLKVVTFNKTPLVSTYLIAWAVGELDDGGRVAKTKDNVQVRVWATKGTPADHGDFAREFAAKTLDFFTEYFGIAYPLPKMDMLAVPDFAAGAMENWGLVTYRTTYVLFDAKNSSLKTKQAVASVVGHELAHQWFGNLVTMEWWSDLWLNEGFASWVGELAVDQQHPEWKVWTEFVVNDCQAGLGLDSLRSSHPIEVPVKSPTEISQIFDSISYSKGASIIRMLVGWLGEETFKKGIQAYLKKFKLSNARTEDLWTSLSEASGKQVNEMMGGWTKHIGYPVIDVKSVQNGKIEVSQRRFLASGDVAKDEDQMIWTIPLFLENESDSIALDIKSTQLPSAALKVNSGQHGFFRVNYPSEWLEKLGEAVKNGRLSNPVDRLGLISDVHSLAVAGDRNMTEFLDLAVKYVDETDYFVWCELLDRLHSVLSLVWENDHLYEQVKLLIKWITEPQYLKLGFDFKATDSDLQKLLRQRIIASAGSAGNEFVITEAKRRFKLFMDGDESAIHPNLRGTVYALVIREGGVPEYEHVLSLYRKLDLPDQKLAALGALGGSRQASVIQAALDLTKTTDTVRSQDVIYIFRSVGANRFGRQQCWSFIESNWPVFHARYQKGGFSLLSRLVTSCTDGFTSTADADKVQAYFDGRGEEQKGIERALQQSLERIRTNARCLLNNSDRLQVWFKKNLKTLMKRA
jgi:aminopeptidase 2